MLDGDSDQTAVFLHAGSAECLDNEKPLLQGGLWGGRPPRLVAQDLAISYEIQDGKQATPHTVRRRCAAQPSFTDPQDR